MSLTNSCPVIGCLFTSPHSHAHGSPPTVITLGRVVPAAGKGEDDLTHYMNATARLTTDNARLRELARGRRVITRARALDMARGALPCSGILRSEPADYPNQSLNYDIDERCGDDDPEFVCEVHAAIADLVMTVARTGIDEATEAALGEREGK